MSQGTEAKKRGNVMIDHVPSFGYACCDCGQDCSGMGKCDSCRAALCFLCCNFEHGPLRRGFQLCRRCLEARRQADG